MRHDRTKAASVRANHRNLVHLELQYALNTIFHVSPLAEVIAQLSRLLVNARSDVGKEGTDPVS